ncbi:major histocompatibility complex class I-related gene protein-like isoform X2 [Ahaetulla prasina]|uniref:major histocompatibility complex class I-related gene protein-like isoform X2 n=1 Tax=Ahaetulla prasina TaxID=499056 RepID=UPI002648F43A|nr:major histocompatibility complex class I-related gene protein-like isoform X2 [Ahaetulla prasina]
MAVCRVSKGEEYSPSPSGDLSGLHTWQAVLGCELGEDGSKGGFLHYGYDGMDFISFDKETLRWVAAQPQAEKVKEMWEDDTRRSQRNIIYLEETCIQMMQKYLPYQKESLKKTEPPVGKVNCKVVDDSLEVLICQAFGFYPKEILATWTRDEEVCEYETLHRNVVPNSDGTYYVWLSIEIDPKERDRFQCHLEHEGLQEPLVLALKEETARPRWSLFGIVAVMILGLWILFLRCWWKRLRKNLYQEVTSLHLPQIHLSPSMDGTEDEMKSQTLPQPKTTSEHKASDGPRRIGRDLEITVLSLHRQEGKEPPAWKTWTCYPKAKIKARSKSKPTKALQNIRSKPKDPAALEGEPGFIYNVIHCKDCNSQYVG